jgi:hypothetical protein
LARVFDEKNYKVIIFVSSDESGSPALITVDRNENPIDTVYLLGDISSNSPERRTIELAEISAGQTIHLIDTVSQWKLTNDGVRIPDTKQITIEEKKYIISESGKFTEIK